jgi:hypothetical protein
MADKALSLGEKWDNARHTDPDATRFSKDDVQGFDTNQMSTLGGTL